jgi:AcrR family transcriptional regulator
VIATELSRRARPAAPRGRPREFEVEKALDQALLLFWRHGYEGTSLAALTMAMRISAPSLYAAFGTKEQLFLKAVDRYLQKPASYLPDALLEPTARRAAEKLFRGAIHMVMNPRHPGGCLLVQGALVSGPIADSMRSELRQRRRRAEAAVKIRFERARLDGDLSRRVDPAALAKFVVTVLWGMSVQAAGGATRAELEQVARMAMKAWPK